MFKNLFVLSLVLSTTAFAQRGADADIGIEAQRVASEVQRAARTLTRNQAAQIYDRLQDIRDVLYGHGVPASSDYTCVSRDNDGRNPYVIGLRDGINITRLPGTTFGTQAECQASIDGIRYLRNTALACISRDNDGRAPYLFAMLDGRGGANKVARSTTNSVSECQSLLQKMILSDRTDTATYCTARDNDGRAPYTAVSLDLNSGAVQGGSESFSAIDQCWSFLGVRP